MSWKDNYRAEKDESGLTWDQFVEREMFHEDELTGLLTHVAELGEQVEALTNEYESMRHELNEVRTMLESDEFDP